MIYFMLMSKTAPFQNCGKDRSLIIPRQERGSWLRCFV